MPSLCGGRPIHALPSWPHQSSFDDSVFIERALSICFQTIPETNRFPLLQEMPQNSGPSYEELAGLRPGSSRAPYQLAFALNRR